MHYIDTNSHSLDNNFSKKISFQTYLTIQLCSQMDMKYCIYIIINYKDYNSYYNIKLGLDIVGSRLTL